MDSDFWNDLAESSTGDEAGGEDEADDCEFWGPGYDKFSDDKK